MTLHLNSAYFPGHTFVIETKKNSAKNLYIQSAKLNGHTLRQCWFGHTELVRGGKLELELGPQPNLAWGH